MRNDKEMEAIRAKMPDKLNVVSMIYHQELGEHPEEPVCIESRWSRRLKSRGQMYQRRLKVGEQPVPVDTGWVERPGTIVIVNCTGQQPTTVPTPQQAAERASHVMELRFGTTGPCWLVRPGESFCASPSTFEGLTVRCQNGMARYTLHVIPE